MKEESKGWKCTKCNKKDTAMYNGMCRGCWYGKKGLDENLKD